MITQMNHLRKFKEINRFCNVLQTQIMKEYPAELTVVFFYNLCVSFIAAIVGLATERNATAWRIRPDIALVSVVCSVRN